MANDRPGLSCMGWCSETLDNCADDECFGCGFCPESSIGFKWWDPDNNYDDRSCLLWGVIERDRGGDAAPAIADRGFAGWRLGDSLVYRKTVVPTAVPTSFSLLLPEASLTHRSSQPASGLFIFSHSSSTTGWPNHNI